MHETNEFLTRPSVQREMAGGAYVSPQGAGIAYDWAQAIAPAIREGDEVLAACGAYPYAQEARLAD